MSRARVQHPSRAKAFTLIELIVVVVILAITAVAVVPKFTGTLRQESSNAVDRVAELMRLFAYRQALGSQQVALWRDGADGRIHLIVKDTDPADPTSAPEWRADRFAAPVALPEGLELLEIRKDDQRVDPAEWTIASVPGGERPKVEIRLAGHGVDATVVLPPGSPSVVRVDADKPEPFARAQIDLDQAGRSREPW
jgi:prepilin-type N-terminal cleavage/methylation domain-containing protein